MTQRRQQVLEEYRSAVRTGDRIAWAELARRCGLYSYNDARRVIRDLEAMGSI